MRRMIATTLTALTALAALTVSGVPGATTHAYVNGTAPALTSFVCNSDGTVTMVWDKNAGKPTEYSLTRVNPTPSAGYRDRIPGSRGSKGSFTVASSFTSSGYVIEAQLYSRTGTTSGVLSATCP